MLFGMSTITVILEPHEDGTVHLPLPAELRNTRVQVTAVVRPEPGALRRPTAEEARAALQQLKQFGTFRSISDPSTWQRSIREDRMLPGRT